MSSLTRATTTRQKQIEQGLQRVCLHKLIGKQRRRMQSRAGGPTGRNDRFALSLHPVQMWQLPQLHQVCKVANLLQI